MRTVAFCETDPYCRAVLAKHWHGVPILGDIRTVGPEQIASLEPIDVICGGFPCQDISEAGPRTGLDGERSGLWSEFHRLIRLIRPRYAIVENVSALVRRGLPRICGDLAEIGYDAEWRVLGADAVGASQHRERLWLVAYPDSTRLEGPIWAWEPTPTRTQWPTPRGESLRSDCGYWPPGPGEVVHIPRMADGPSNRAHRLVAIANAVVPQIPELIGEAIMRTST